MALDFERIKSILPNFHINDFSMFDRITLLKWETKLDDCFWEYRRNLTLEMVSDGNYKIIMEFLDVDILCLRGDGQIKGFYIQDMSEAGYENDVSYRVGDHEENIEFYCSDVIVKKFEKLPDNNFSNGTEM